VLKRRGLKLFYIKEPFQVSLSLAMISISYYKGQKIMIFLAADTFVKREDKENLSKPNLAVIY
jgi:hypothetical protein